MFTVPGQKAQAVWCFELRDGHQPALELGDELQLNLIELPKADRLGFSVPALAAWVALLESWQAGTAAGADRLPPVQKTCSGCAV